MYWLNNNIGWRENPKLMWEDVETIIVFAENYYKGGNPLSDINVKDIANISIYARGDDYHNVLKKKLKAVASQIIKLVDKSEVKVLLIRHLLWRKILLKKQE